MTANPALDLRAIAKQLNITPRELEKALEKYAAEQTQDLATNPISALVYPETVQEFMAAVGPVTIVRSVGRSIHVRRKSGRFPSFADLARELLGTGKPCDEFTVNDADLYARLKTIGQTGADNAATGWDDYHLGVDHTIGVPPIGELFTYCFNDLEWADHQGAGASNAAPTRSRSKAKVPEGTATFVMKAMKAIAPAGTIDTEKLIAEAIKYMPVRKDSRGQDRREDYAARAVQKLVALELLHVHGDNQDKVSLTRLVTSE